MWRSLNLAVTSLHKIFHRLRFTPVELIRNLTIVSLAIVTIYILVL